MVFIELGDIIVDFLLVLFFVNNMYFSLFIFEGYFILVEVLVLFCLFDFYWMELGCMWWYFVYVIFGWLNGIWGLIGFEDLIFYV